jgi:hypothetical protein
VIPLSRRSLLFVALALYCTSRLFVLLTGFDEVAIPVYEVPSMGNAAWLASTGWRGVPWSASYDNAGGQVLTAWLAAPFYVLFGNRYVALKLVPFVLGALLLVMLWRVVLRVRGPRAANLAALAFALAPPLLFKYSLLAKGNHFEGLFFVFVPVWLLFEAEGRTRRWPFVALAGLAAGFALSVYVGSLATLAALAAAVLALRGVRAGALDFAIALPGFLVGLLPAVALHLATEGHTWKFIARYTRVDKAQPSFTSEARELLTVHLPHATCCEPIGALSGRALDAVYLAAAAVAFLVLLARAFPRAAGARGTLRGVPDSRSDERVLAVSGSRSNERSLTVLTLGAPLVALAALLFTPLRIRVMPPPVEVGGLRYFVPFHFWSLVAIPLAVSVLLESPRRIARLAALGLALAFAAAGASSLAIGGFTRGAAELAWSYPGNHVRLFSTLMGRAVAVDPTTGFRTPTPEGARAALDALAPFERADAAHSFGSRLFMEAFLLSSARPDPVEREAGLAAATNLDQLFAALPAGDRSGAAVGVGALLALQIPHQAGAPTPPNVRAALDRLLVSAYATEVVRGLGTTADYPLHLTLAQDFRRAVAAAGHVPSDLRALVLGGLGDDCGRRVARGARLERELIGNLASGLQPADRTPFWRGLGEALHARGVSSLDVDDWVPSEDVDTLRAAARGE